MTDKTVKYNSMNMTAAINTKKVAHLGKNYASIDFEIKEHVNATDYKYSKMKPIIGTFVIGNRRVDVTYSELNNIMRTASEAMQLCDQSYRMGKWGKATR
jgi:hypothetical protein|tara:strand:+ start:3000 stop:3299 length:300 start_codon:yes stop_codon:yes gene_type:complete